MRYFCKGCGIEKGYSHGTGDCGCGVGFTEIHFEPLEPGRVELFSRPMWTGFWVEYVAGNPRQVVRINVVNQEYPSSSRWYPIPEGNPL